MEKADAELQKAAFQTRPEQLKVSGYERSDRKQQDDAQKMRTEMSTERQCVIDARAGTGRIRVERTPLEEAGTKREAEFQRQLHIHGAVLADAEWQRNAVVVLTSEVHEEKREYRAKL